MRELAKVSKRGAASGFTCTECKKWHMFGVYVAAHAHVELVHTCDCGAKHRVLDYVVDRVQQEVPDGGR